MENMKVRYNGWRKSYTWCSDPSVLVAGQEYTVVRQRVMNWQTNYTLKEVPGEFNSVWFDPVEDSHPSAAKPADESHTFIAATRNVPVVGKRLLINRFDVIDGEVEPQMVRTSRVTGVSLVGDNIYRVKTHNSTYMMLVLEP